MAEVQDLLPARVKLGGHVYVFVDACHAGIIGSIRTAHVNEDAEAQLLGAGAVFSGQLALGDLDHSRNSSGYLDDPG